ADRPRDGSERGDPEGRDRCRRHALRGARHRSREEPLHVLGLWPRGSGRATPGTRRFRPRGHDEPWEDLPRRRCVRRHPDGADQARARGGHVGVALSADLHAIDGITPRNIVRATSEAEVADTIRGANERGEAIVISGGATRLGVGDPPARYDTALDLSALRGIVEYEPGDLVATVRAGTTLAELAEALTPRGQRWPVADADIPEAFETARLLQASGLPLDALAIVTGEAAGGLGARGDAGLLVRLTGPAAAVRRLGREVRELVRWRDVANEVWNDIGALPLEAKWAARVAWPSATRPAIQFAGYPAVIYPGNSTAYLLRSIDR